jgi:protein dithiol oxidoreductase (disulfide-forming)
MTARRMAANWFGALVMAIAAGAALSQTGGEVLRLDPPRPVASGERIEVIEFFYYGCPVCYELEPQLTRWLATQAPDYIALRRIPALLNSESWEPFAKLYYTLEAMGQLSRLHWPVYDNFHFEGKLLNDEKVMLEWVGENGIDRGKFTEVYGSEAIQTKIGQTREMMKSYGVRGVPTIVVDGKYLSSVSLSGSTRQLMQIVDRLVRQAKSERQQ